MGLIFLMTNRAEKKLLEIPTWNEETGWQYFLTLVCREWFVVSLGWKYRSVFEQLFVVEFPTK